MRDSAGRPTTTLRKRILRTSLLCVVLYVIACIGVALFQRRLLYFPKCIRSGTLDQMAKSQGFERWKNPSGDSIGWRAVSPVQPAQGQVLVTHGNAGCAIERSDYAPTIQKI